MTDTFHVETASLLTALQSARNAQTAEDIRTTCKQLASILFEGMPFLRCKYLNMLSESNAVEMVVQYNGWSSNTVFDVMGRYFLLQCKAWSAPVLAEDIRTLLGSMRTSRVRLGVILAPTGICGRRTGGEAVREMRRGFEAHDMYTVIIAAEHLRQVANGANFYDMLEYLIERTRFDFI